MVARPGSARLSAGFKPECLSPLVLIQNKRQRLSNRYKTANGEKKKQVTVSKTETQGGRLSVKMTEGETVDTRDKLGRKENQSERKQQRDNSMSNKTDTRLSVPAAMAPDAPSNMNHK